MADYKLYYVENDETSMKFIEELEQQQVDYEKVNVIESMKNLKEFLLMRDTRMEFEEMKHWGQVGLPVVILPNNRLIFDLIDLNGTACTITPHH